MTLQSSHSVLCLLGVTSGKAISRCPDPTWMHWQNVEPLTDECHCSSIGVGFRVSSAKCVLADAKPVTVSLTKQMVEVIKTTSHGSSSYDFEQDFFQLDFWSQSWTSQHSPLAAHLGWIDGTPGTPLSAHLFRESSCCPVCVPRSCCRRVVLKRTAPCGPLCRMATPGFRRWWPTPSRGAALRVGLEPTLWPQQPDSERGSSVQHHPCLLWAELPHSNLSTGNPHPALPGCLCCLNQRHSHLRFWPQIRRRPVCAKWLQVSEECRLENEWGDVSP